MYIIYIHTLSPRTGIEHLVGIGITDRVIDDSIGHCAVDEKELGIMVIASQRDRTLRIEVRIGNHQFLVVVAASVVPDECASVSIETAACGIAPTARTKEVNTWATQEKVGMIIHSFTAFCP